MNKDTLNGSIKELKGRIKAKWGKLTEVDLEEAKSNLELLSGKIQKVYGRTKEAASKEVEDFKKSFAPKTQESREDKNQRS